MNILLLAPHPFYTNRGTPIAVKYLCEGLSALGHQLDVLTYHVGEAISLPGVTVHRIHKPPFIRRVPIGPSWQKLICDFYLAVEMRRMLRRKRYDLVHAVEESAFLAARSGIPFVYDMDSLMSRQIVEKSPLLWPAAKVFAFLEHHALRHCIGAVAVCESIAQTARQYQRNVQVLPDVAMAGDAPGDLPEAVISAKGIRLMYVGNMQRYQGVDLMVQAFALIIPEHPEAVLVLVGGTPEEIREQQRRTDALGTGAQVIFAGQAPVEALGRVLAHADILVSPRIKGDNTPMKLYSYLLSGKPVLATRLATHTQVVGDEQALLVEPTVEAMAKGMDRLLRSPELRAQLGQAGYQLAVEQYSRSAFEERLARFYQLLPLGSLLESAPEYIDKFTNLF
jgi:glycosyltransferase involved in cell wall biosynthesis